MKRIDKDHKEEIMKRIKEAGDPENYEISWDKEGIPKSKKKSEIKKGKKSKSKGAVFELKVRKDLENKGCTVSKWVNNIDLEENKIIPSKRVYNPFKKAMTIGTGFPDFISIKLIRDDLYFVEGVEVKINGILSKIEKEKCRWFLDNKIFSRILIAKRGKKRGEIEYVDFAEKYKKT